MAFLHHVATFRRLEIDPQVTSRTFSQGFPIPRITGIGSDSRKLRESEDLQVRQAGCRSIRSGKIRSLGSEAHAESASNFSTCAIRAFNYPQVSDLAGTLM